MALVVEDGTGKPDANSYESVAEFSAYCSARGMEITANFTPTAQEQALIKAAEFIDLTKGPRFKGRRLLVTQALEFPRACLFEKDFCTPITGVPNKLKYAQSEYAFRELTSPGSLMPDPVVDDTGMQLLQTIEKVGPIEESKRFVGSAPKSVKSFPKADAFLRQYLTSEGARSQRA